jgi:homopolymeric O-antigen transport system permease protein
MNPPEAAAVAAPEILIAPPARWRAIDLRELWAHRELVYFLTKRELQIRYKQSFFGISWAVLQPLTFAVIFAVVIGGVLHYKPPGHLPFMVFAVSSIVPWLFVAQAIQGSAGSLVLDANLIAKVYFPRLALPLSKGLSLLLDLGIALVLVLVVTLLYGVTIASTAWLVPAFLLLGVVTAFSIGTFLAAVNVKYRDIQLVVPMLVQIMFFASPVLYDGTQIRNPTLQHLYSVNPMASVLDGMRWALFDTPYPGTLNILISVVSATVILLGGLIYFRSVENYFADVI